MKILILGADGMIGHKLSQKFYNSSIDLHLNSRKNSAFLKQIFPKANVYKYDFLINDVNQLLKKVKPNFILNSCGITTRRGVSLNLTNTKKINIELPNLIHKWALKNKSKLIHFSTDCVFNGKKGNYKDNEVPDAVDVYGLTKAKGEINMENTLTIRSSTIGREIFNKTELLEWIFSQNENQINGYSNVIYSGITTLQMSKYVYEIIDKNILMHGIYNVSSNFISKFDLIYFIIKKFNLNINLKKDRSVFSNKSLNSTCFFKKTGFKKPLWNLMIDELFLDSIKFNELYKNYYSDKSYNHCWN